MTDLENSQGCGPPVFSGTVRRIAVEIVEDTPTGGDGATEGKKSGELAGSSDLLDKEFWSDEDREALTEVMDLEFGPTISGALNAGIDTLPNSVNETGGAFMENGKSAGECIKDMAQDAVLAGANDTAQKGADALTDLNEDVTCEAGVGRTDKGQIVAHLDLDWVLIGCTRRIENTPLSWKVEGSVFLGFEWGEGEGIDPAGGGRVTAGLLHPDSGVGLVGGVQQDFLGGGEAEAFTGFEVDMGQLGDWLFGG